MMSNLTDYAEAELRRAGLMDPDSDYGGMLGSAALELVTVFAGQGHSGMSAEITTQIFERLARYKPLTPLTYAPDEWNEVGTGTWQNCRQSSIFSEDGGRTWYDIEEPGRPRHKVDDRAD